MSVVNPNLQRLRIKGTNENSVRVSYFYIRNRNYSQFEQETHKNDTGGL